MCIIIMIIANVLASLFIKNTRSNISIHLELCFLPPEEKNVIFILLLAPKKNDILLISC